MKKESFSSGVLFMSLSAIALAIIGFLGKIGTERFLLTSLIFWRYFTAFVVCLSTLWIMGELKGALRFSHVKGHLLRAFFVLGAQYSFFYYMEQNTLLNAAALLNTGPLFIPIIEWGILRNKVGKSSWIGVVVSFIGVLCILQPDRGIFSLTSLIGLLSGVCQGASQVIFGINSRTERSDISVLYLMFYCALFSIVPYIMSDATWAAGHQMNFSNAILVLGLGIASLGNQLWRAVAYQHGSPSRLSSFLYFSVVLAGFLDWAAFNKIPNALSIIGAGLVILGGLLKIYLRFKILQKTK